jgi:hypothetical protein
MFEFNEGNLNSVIERSFKIAIFYLRSVHPRNYKFLDYNEDTIKCLAIDAITPLFTSTGNVLPVKEAFDNWHPAIETEEEFSFFINKIVSNKVEQHITKLLQQKDPLYDTIYNSINYLIRKNRKGKTRYIGTVYLTESGTKKINGKVINNESFDLIPGSKFSDDRNLLQNIFFYLRTETEFFPAVPLNALVHRFKELKTSGYNFVEKAEAPVKTYIIQEFINKGLITAKDKLDTAFIRKKKLEKDDAQRIFDALKNLGEALKDGGVSTGLFEYLKPHFENLSEENYKRKYKSVLEYLFKVMRVTIANELKK